MIDTTTIYPDDSIVDHLVKTRILLMEMSYLQRQHEPTKDFLIERGEEDRIHNLIRHNTVMAEKIGLDINKHPVFVAWQKSFDRIHNPSAPYLND